MNSAQAVAAVESKYYDLIAKAVDAICKSEDTRDNTLESFEMYRNRVNLEAIKEAKLNLSSWKEAFVVVINELTKAGDQHAIQHIVQGIDNIKKWLDSNKGFTDETIASLCGFDADILEKMYQIGRNSFEAGHIGDAGKVFGLIVTLDPGYAVCWTALGIILHAERHYKEGLFAFSMARQIDEQNPLVYLYSARCYKQLNMKKEAEQMLQQALQHALGKQQYKAVVHSIKAEQAKA